MIPSSALQARNRNDFLVKASDVPENNDAPNKGGVLQTDTAPVPAGQDRIMLIDIPTGPESYKRFLEESNRGSKG